MDALKVEIEITDDLLETPAKAAKQLDNMSMCLRRLLATVLMSDKARIANPLVNEIIGATAQLERAGAMLMPTPQIVGAGQQIPGLRPQGRA